MMAEYLRTEKGEDVRVLALLGAIQECRLQTEPMRSLVGGALSKWQLTSGAGANPEMGEVPRTYLLRMSISKARQIACQPAALSFPGFAKPPQAVCTKRSEVSNSMLGSVRLIWC